MSSLLLHKINFDFGVWIFIHGLIFLPFHHHLLLLFLDEIGLVWTLLFDHSRNKFFFFLGMRFFRIARILNIPDILQFLHILRSSNSIRLTRMLCLLFTVWLSAAGFVHLVRRSIIFERKRCLYEYLGREFGRFFSKLFKFTINYVFPMCLFSYRHNEVRR